MKKLTSITLLLFISAYSFANEKTENIKTATVYTAGSDSAHGKPHGYVVLLTSGPGLMLYHSTAGILNISFPYSVINSSGVILQNVFQSSKSNIFSYYSPIISFLGCEFGTPKAFFTIGINTSISYSGFNYEFGYGYNLYYKNRKLYTSKTKQSNTLVIKPSLNFSYYQLQTGLGVINNFNTNLYIFGGYANSTYQTTYKGTTTTHTASVVNVDFYQMDYAFSPKISISNNPYSHVLNWEITCGYIIPLSENGGLSVYQVGTDGDQYSFTGNKLTPLNLPGIHALFNTTTITNSPYTFRSLFLGAT
ncbi:MAG TPA: hypothetical protein VN922_13595, partial [Bacteroidia bacterium]|nr:hypothetical protein [Bacteroidia bacterium]